MAAPRLYATSTDLGRMFGTTSKYANEWLEKAGVKPHKHIVVNGRNFYKWRLSEALPAMEAHRASIEQSRQSAADKRKAEAERREEITRQTAMAAAMEAAQREQEAKASNGVDIDTAHKPAPEPLPSRGDDGPNYEAAEREEPAESAVTAAYVLRELRELKALMNQILDAITTPEGLPG